MSTLKLTAVDSSARTVSGFVAATNSHGTRHIGIAFYIPDVEMMTMLGQLETGTVIKVNSLASEPGSPCAMTMIDFEVVEE